MKSYSRREDNSNKQKNVIIYKEITWLKKIKFEEDSKMSKNRLIEYYLIVGII